MPPMSALALLLAAEKTPAQEGRDIILAMLVTGLIFVVVILLGQALRYFEHKRKAQRAQRRPY
jgi:heme/copper-type cytochrome/quinol oxidase subunit 2